LRLVRSEKDKDVVVSSEWTSTYSISRKKKNMLLKELRASFSKPLAAAAAAELSHTTNVNKKECDPEQSQASTTLKRSSWMQRRQRERAEEEQRALWQKRSSEHLEHAVSNYVAAGIEEEMFLFLLDKDDDDEAVAKKNQVKNSSKNKETGRNSGSTKAAEKKTTKRKSKTNRRSSSEKGKTAQAKSKEVDQVDGSGGSLKDHGETILRKPSSEEEGDETQVTIECWSASSSSLQGSSISTSSAPRQKASTKKKKRRLSTATNTIRQPQRDHSTSSSTVQVKVTTTSRDSTSINEAKSRSSSRLGSVITTKAAQRTKPQSVGEFYRHAAALEQQQQNEAEEERRRQQEQEQEQVEREQQKQTMMIQEMITQKFSSQEQAVQDRLKELELRLLEEEASRKKKEEHRVDLERRFEQERLELVKVHKDGLKRHQEESKQAFQETITAVTARCEALETQVRSLQDQVSAQEKSFTLGSDSVNRQVEEETRMREGEENKLRSEVTRRFEELEQRLQDGHFERALEAEEEEKRSDQERTNRELKALVEDLELRLHKQEIRSRKREDELQKKMDSVISENQSRPPLADDKAASAATSKSRSDPPSGASRLGLFSRFRKPSAPSFDEQATHISLESSVDSLVESVRLPRSETSPLAKSSMETKRVEYRDEVEALVALAVPESIENVDEMMSQFAGREEELVQTLRSMHERAIALKARHAPQEPTKQEDSKSAETVDPGSKDAPLLPGAQSSTNDEYPSEDEAEIEDLAVTFSELDITAHMKGAVPSFVTSSGLSVDTKSLISEHTDSVDYMEELGGPSDQKTRKIDANRAAELDRLVAAGDWQGILETASVFERERAMHEHEDLEARLVERLEDSVFQNFQSRLEGLEVQFREEEAQRCTGVDAGTMEKKELDRLLEERLQKALGQQHAVYDDLMEKFLALVEEQGQNQGNDMAERSDEKRASSLVWNRKTLFILLVAIFARDE
jgi:hypothetical protein